MIIQNFLNLTSHHRPAQMIKNPPGMQKPSDPKKQKTLAAEASLAPSKALKKAPKLAVDKHSKGNSAIQT